MVATIATLQVGLEFSMRNCEVDSYCYISTFFCGNIMIALIIIMKNNAVPKYSRNTVHAIALTY
jgi:hypothetical protein